MQPARTRVIPISAAALRGISKQKHSGLVTDTLNLPSLKGQKRTNLQSQFSSTNSKRSLSTSPKHSQSSTKSTTSAQQANVSSKLEQKGESIDREAITSTAAERLYLQSPSRDPMKFIDTYFRLADKMTGFTHTSSFKSMGSAIKALATGIVALFLAGKLFMDEEEVEQLFVALREFGFLSNSSVVKSQSVSTNTASEVHSLASVSASIGSLSDVTRTQTHTQMQFSASDPSDLGEVNVKQSITSPKVSDSSVDGFDSIEKYEDLEEEFDKMQDEIEEELHWKVLHKQPAPRRTLGSALRVLLRWSIFPVQTTFQFTAYALRITCLALRLSPLIVSFGIMQLILYVHRAMYTEFYDKDVALSFKEVNLDPRSPPPIVPTVRIASLGNASVTIQDVPSECMLDADEEVRVNPPKVLASDIRLNTSSGPVSGSGGRLTVVNGKLTTITSAQKQAKAQSLSQDRNERDMEDLPTSSSLSRTNITTIKDATFANEDYVMPDSPLLDKLKLFFKIHTNRLFIVDNSGKLPTPGSGDDDGNNGKVMTSDRHGRVISSQEYSRLTSPDSKEGSSVSNMFFNTDSYQSSQLESSNPNLNPVSRSKKENPPVQAVPEKKTTLIVTPLPSSISSVSSKNVTIDIAPVKTTLTPSSSESLVSEIAKDSGHIPTKQPKMFAPVESSVKNAESLLASAHAHSASHEDMREKAMRERYSARLRHSQYSPPDWIRSMEDMWWAWLTNALESAGPTFIKLGQYASSRQDVFSAEICARLGKLRDATEVHSWDATELALQTHIGMDWEEYIYISDYDRENPIGSGCIAQVYRGYVYPNTSTSPVVGSFQATSDLTLGSPRKSLSPINDPSALSSSFAHDSLEARKAAIRPVAIKVLHPNVSWQISRDLKLIAFLAEIAESIPFLGLRWVSPSEMCIEFSRLMKTQLNLNREAKNLIKFANNFKNDYRMGMPFCVEFPQVILSRSGVLVESFQSGIPISQLLQENRQVLDLDMSRNMLHDKTPIDYSSCDTIPGLISYIYSQAAAILRLNNRKVINNEHMDEEAHNLLVREKLEELVEATRSFSSGSPFEERDDYGAIAGSSTSSLKNNQDNINLGSKESEYENVLSPNTDIIQLAVLRSLSPRQRMYLQREIAKCGLYAFMRMMFEHGFFHADLHPGNIIVDLGYTNADLTYSAAKKMRKNGELPHTPRSVPPSGAIFGSYVNPPKNVDSTQNVLQEGTDPSKDWDFGQFVTAAKSIFSLDNNKFIRLYDDISAKPADDAINEDDYDEGVLPGDYSTVFPSKVFEFIHADDMNTHPSYFVNENTYKAKFMENMLPVPDVQPKLVMIDAGMSTVLTKYDMRNFRDLFFFVASGRGEEAAALMIERAKPTAYEKTHPRTAEEHRLFVKEVSAVIDQAFYHGFNLNSMSIVNTLTSLLNAARTYRVKLDTSFISVIIAVTVMEGVGRSLDPDVNVISPALEIVAKSKLNELKEHFVGKMHLTTQAQALASITSSSPALNHPVGVNSVARVVSKDNM